MMSYESVVNILSFRLVLSLAMATLPVAIGRPSSCSPYKEFTITYPNGTESCQKCSKCVAGYGLPKTCGERVSAGTSTDCKPCEANKFSDATAFYCSPCDHCRPGFKVLKECNRTQNRKCSGTCETNYRLDNAVDPPDCIFSPKAEASTLTATKEPTMTTNEPVNTATPLVDSRTPPRETTASTTEYSTADTAEYSSLQSADKDNRYSVVIGAVFGASGLVAVICSLFYIRHRRSKPKPQVVSDAHVSNENKENGTVVLDVVLKKPEEIEGRRLSGISPDLENKLMLELDVDHNGEPGWKKLGSAFGIDNAIIKYLDLEYRRDNGSPTIKLLEILKSRGKTVTDLINNLNDPKVNRGDVALLVIENIETKTV